MRTRKLKWRKVNDIKDPIMNCCSWSVIDKKTKLDFYITYYVEGGKYTVDSCAYLGDTDEPIYLEEMKRTKFDLKNFEKLELEAFKSKLLNCVELKLIDILDSIRKIKK